MEGDPSKSRGICPVCWKMFENWVGRGKPKTYCSNKCRNKKNHEAHKKKRNRVSRETYWRDLEKAKADQKQWKAENPDKVKAIQKRWASKNKAKMAANHAKWRQANPEKAKALCSRRRARRRANGVEDTVEFRERMTAVGTRQVCFYCGVDCTGDYHWDHFIPISRGGPDAEWNLRVSCPGCNQRKHARMPESVFCEEMRL